MKIFLKIGSDFMQEVTREFYTKNIADYEKVMLIETEEDKIYLRADIENEENLRIETMDFEMDSSLNFIDSNSESRNCNKKIYFIEYKSNELAERNILKDFLNLSDNAIFLLCRDNELKNILPKYKNQSIYVLIE